MHPFSYTVARSMNAAFDFSSHRGTMFIAGGTDMLQLLQDDVVVPGTLIDITPLRAASASVGWLVRWAWRC
jgi:CO/xanthine dehydrogenase FAD-binding subunit